MTLKIYNTLTRKKEEFKPIKPGKVGMYVCGVTVYDSCHLGHARAAIVFDMVYRHLKFSGYDVTYVRNYTDVDDKIIKRANDDRKSCREITEHYIDEYEADTGALGVLNPTIKPKATEHIADMIATISKLIDNGLAYDVNGDVYFSVRDFNGYGKLSGKNIEDLESGARVEPGEHKRDPLDFALWKAAKPGEPKWASPWGEGRPGWHIECSSMSTKYLGQPFDIHGGGVDLVFPHHENEIAQAEGACGCKFVNYWMHNGHLKIESEKMSKSLGNFLTIREMLKRYDAEVVRLFILSNHYRSPLDFTEKGMDEAKSSLDRFYEAAARVRKADLGPASPDRDAFGGFEAKFREAMDDDFNTAMAIGLVFDAVRTLNKLIDERGSGVGSFRRVQEICGSALGVFGSDPGEYLGRVSQMARESKGIDAAEVEALIAERLAARKAKDFKRADAIRAELSGKGIEIKDKPDGTTEWKVR